MGKREDVFLGVRTREATSASPVALTDQTDASTAFSLPNFSKDALRDVVALNDDKDARQGDNAESAGLCISRAIRVRKAVAHEDDLLELAIIARAVDRDLESLLDVICPDRDRVRIDLHSYFSADILVQNWRKTGRDRPCFLMYALAFSMS